MYKKATLLLLISLCSLWSMGQQINITTFRVKGTLPAEINAWAKDPTSVLLVANKIPLQKFDQAKLVIQIKSNGVVICGYQPQDLKTKDSSFTLKTFSASNLVSLLPGCDNLKPGTYQLSAQFFNTDNKAISTESLKTFIVPGNNSPTTIPQCTNVSISQIASCHGSLNGNPAYATIPNITNNSGQPIVSWTVTSTDVILYNGVTPVTTYQGTPALINPGTFSPSPIMFTNPAPMPIYFNYTFTFASGLQCRATVAVDYTPCAPTCTCLSWPATITYGFSTNGGPVINAGTVANNGTIVINPHQFLAFPNLQAPCANPATCNSNLTYELYNPNNISIPLGASGVFPSSTINQQPCNSSGKYKLIIKAKCGTTSCNDFVVWIDKPCPPCLCAAAPQVFIKKLINNVEQLFPYSCNQAAPYINKLSCNVNDTFVVKNFCTGNCNNSSINFSVTTPNFTGYLAQVLSTGPNEIRFIIPPSNQNGVYKIDITPNCGGQTCTTCRIEFQQNCLPLCNFIQVAFQNQTICAGASSTLGITTPEAGINYLWTSIPASTLPATSSITVTPAVTTTYTLSRTNANPNCPAKTSTVTITVAPCCDPTCAMGLTVKNMVTNQTTVCNPNTTLQFNCGQDYFFTRSLSCTPANPNITFKQVNVANYLNQPVSWASNFVLSGANGTLTIPSNAVPGVYTITYTFGTNTQVCKSVNYTFEIICVPADCCTGSYWKEPITLVDAAGNTLLELDCKAPKPIYIDVVHKNCDIPILVKGLFVCNTSNCPSKVVYVLSNNIGTVVSGTGSLTIPANLPNGTYILSYIAYCGNKICETCKFEVVKNCLPQCVCGKWGNLSIQGHPVSYPCNKIINWNCNKPFNFTQSFACTSTGSVCNAKITWAIKKGTIPITNGNGLNTISGSFTPTQNGIYSLIITSTCNGIQCTPCGYEIRVVDCCEPKSIAISKNGLLIPSNACLWPGQHTAAITPPSPVITGTYTYVELQQVLK
jgi:hypothetical protein